MDIAKGLREYARLLVCAGVNLQKGQTLVINAPVAEAALVRYCTEEAYRAGCREVFYTWTDGVLEKMKYLYADDGVFDEFPSWEAEMMERCSKNGYSRISIMTYDPTLTQGVDTEKMSRAYRADRAATKGFCVRQNNGDFPWCVCAAPTPGWAKEVFPDKPESDALRSLWEAILTASRIGEGDSVLAWRVHTEKIARLKDALDSFHFSKLHFKNALGTDITLALPERHFFMGGTMDCTRDTRPFCPNIPTEEVFTAPSKYGVNGVAVASRPLVLQGHTIEGILLEFSGGRIVRATAQTNEELLLRTLDTDDGARYLGEVALVSADSPISRSTLLFHNTLFDENAASHLAFGAAYPCVAGAEHMSDAEKERAGLNTSSTHVDFMIGTEDLRVTGVTANGCEVIVMENGLFAFDDK